MKELLGNLYRNTHVRVEIFDDIQKECIDTTYYDYLDATFNYSYSTSIKNFAKVANNTLLLCEVANFIKKAQKISIIGDVRRYYISYGTSDMDKYRDFINRFEYCLLIKLDTQPMECYITKDSTEFTKVRIDLPKTILHPEVSLLTIILER